MTWVVERFGLLQPCIGDPAVGVIAGLVLVDDLLEVLEYGIEAGIGDRMSAVAQGQGAVRCQGEAGERSAESPMLTIIIPLVSTSE